MVHTHFCQLFTECSSSPAVFALASVRACSRLITAIRAHKRSSFSLSLSLPSLNYSLTLSLSLFLRSDWSQVQQERNFSVAWLPLRADLAQRFNVSEAMKWFKTVEGECACGQADVCVCVCVGL